MKFKEIIDALNGNSRRRATTRAVVGTSIGVLVGATTGILLAPKSGKEIRKDMRHGAEWSVEKTRGAALKTAEFFKETATTVNKSIIGKMNDLKTHLKSRKVMKD